MKNGADIQFREIERKDVEQIYALMRALAEHENEQHYLSTTPEQLGASGFGENRQWRGFLAEANNQVIGFVTFADGYHIWSGDPRIALDDLYVEPNWRGHGVGGELMRRVLAIAEKSGALVSWSVQRENRRAIKFYEGLGATIDIVGKCLWRPPR